MKHSVAALCVLLLSTLSMPASRADDRALLIGLGRYRTVSPLPGIELDVDVMRELASLLGFPAASVQLMQNEQATLQAVDSAIESTLRLASNTEDRVLIYVSGHGTQVPDMNQDEEDGADEALVMYDSQPARLADGRGTLANVLLDDRLGDLLARAASRHVMVILDTCHSGTATRSFAMTNRSINVRQAQSKSFAYPGMPVGRKSMQFGKMWARDSSHLLLAAAQDDESAVATAQGSVFTLGLRESLRAAAAAGTPLTPRSWLREAGRYVAEHLDAARLFHPRFTGSGGDAERPLPLTPLRDGHGPNWRKLEALARGCSGTLTASTEQEVYRLKKDFLTVSANLPHHGYFHILQVDAKDDATILFPNRFDASNEVAAGPITVPAVGSGFRLRATEPGPTLLVFVLRSRPMANLYDLGFGGDQPVRGLSPAAFRGFGPEADAGPAGDLCATLVREVRP